ncbi:unnamed protein product, partial [Iphiclides podalirius]
MENRSENSNAAAALSSPCTVDKTNRPRGSCPRVPALGPFPRIPASPRSLAHILWPVTCHLPPATCHRHALPPLLDAIFLLSNKTVLQIGIGRLEFNCRFISVAARSYLAPGQTGRPTARPITHRAAFLKGIIVSTKTSQPPKEVRGERSALGHRPSRPFREQAFRERAATPRPWTRFGLANTAAKSHSCARVRRVLRAPYIVQDRGAVWRIEIESRAFLA